MQQHLALRHGEVAAEAGKLPGMVLEPVQLEGLPVAEADLLAEFLPGEPIPLGQLQERHFLPRQICENGRARR